jgi:hypothetical protein
MRYAKPHELTENVVPVLQLRLSERQFDAMFPVKTVDLDPLAAPEPSRAALIRLDSGSYVVVTYGEVTHRAVVEVPRSADATNVVRELFSEVDVPSGVIEWNVVDVKPAAKKLRTAAATKVKQARSTTKATDETKLAEEIVGVVGGDVVRVCSDDRDSLRFAIRSAALKLRSIVLNRASLRRLLLDPAGEVKIAYLKRDLRRAAQQQVEYVFPKAVEKSAKSALAKKLKKVTKGL